MLADDQLLVSRTDTKGRMTFANKAIADVSGFSGTELLGAPHNLTLLRRGDIGCRMPLPLVLITRNRSPPSHSNCDRNREVMQVCSGAGESVGDV